LGVELPHPQEGHPLGLDLEGGQGPPQTGQLTLLIAQGIAPGVLLVKAALGHQLNGVAVHPDIGLHSFDGNDNIIFHSGGTSVLVFRLWMKRKLLYTFQRTL
jgi:hypothetical protein